MTARPDCSAADFLVRELAGGAIAVPELETKARAAGLLRERQQIGQAKVFRKAKTSLGIRSIRDGFGIGGKWAWVLPTRVRLRATEPASAPGIDPQEVVHPAAAADDPERALAELQKRDVRLQWAHGIARLDYHRPPTDVPLHRWRQFVGDCNNFLTANERWPERAEKLGWDDLALFGCRRTRPLEHLGSAGLVWAIMGGRLVQLYRDCAVIERAEDRSRSFHHRRRLNATQVMLPWSGLCWRKDS